jgi:hypothetical protein
MHPSKYPSVRRILILDLTFFVELNSTHCQILTLTKVLFCYKLTIFVIQNEKYIIKYTRRLCKTHPGGPRVDSPSPISCKIACVTWNSHKPPTKNYNRNTIALSGIFHITCNVAKSKDFNFKFTPRLLLKNIKPICLIRDKFLKCVFRLLKTFATILWYRRNIGVLLQVHVVLQPKRSTPIAKNSFETYMY